MAPSQPQDHMTSRDVNVCYIKSQYRQDKTATGERERSYKLEKEIERRRGSDGEERGSEKSRAASGSGDERERRIARRSSRV